MTHLIIIPAILWILITPPHITIMANFPAWYEAGGEHIAFQGRVTIPICAELTVGAL